MSAVNVNVPSYLNRDGFFPRNPGDFGHGGAFPEINMAQYPLEMGRKDAKLTSKILPVTVDSQGNVEFDAVVRQGENVSKIVYSRHSDLVPKILKDEGVDEDEETGLDEEERRKENEEETMNATKAAMEEIINAKLGNIVSNKSSASNFIKYKPSQQSVAFNSGAKERVIRMVEMPVDPLEPPKFKHKRVPKASGSPPVPVLHSPPRPVTVKDQQDCKIPPCISNWKNSKGYVVPLDKRLATDGRGLQEVQISDKFAALSEGLYVAEEKARVAVALRSKVQKELAMKEKENREQELRSLAAKALSEKTGLVAPLASNMDTDGNEAIRESEEEREGRLERDKVRLEMKKERVRERRLEAKSESLGKKRKITRDKDRDISEKVALGMASVGSRRGEVLYDQRLFNQEKGMESGFATDDQYNVYDKGLFTTQATLSTLCQPKKDQDSDMYGGADEELEKIKNSKRFKPDRALTGTLDKAAPRDRPVEFEQEAPAEEADPFGLSQWLEEVNTAKKAMEGVGRGGTMKASGGSSRNSDGLISESKNKTLFC